MPAPAASNLATFSADPIANFILGIVKRFGEFVVSRFLAGVLVVTPVYLAGWLLFKIIKALSNFVQPLAKLLPEWLPAERILSLLLVLVGCFLIGIIVRTTAGRTAWKRIEASLFQRIPGYAVVQSLTQRVAGETEGEGWRPVLAEIEEALVPGFIIEETDDGRFTVFVPSVPTPFAGSLYILTPDRVHPLNVSFTHALKVISRWGSGAKDLIAAMDTNRIPPDVYRVR